MRTQQTDGAGVPRLRLAIKIAFILATVLLIFALAQLGRSGVHIDTSLRSLSPAVSADPLSEKLVAQLSASASRRANVVLASTSRTQLAAAAERFRSSVAKMEEEGQLVKLVDPAETASQYLKVLEEYPFNFLSPSLASILASEGDSRATKTIQTTQATQAPQTTQWVLEQLYGSAGQVRLTQFQRDPFGALNDYAVYLQDRLVGNDVDEIRAVDEDGVRHYFSVWQFQLPGDGLALNTQSQWIAELNSLQQDLQAHFADVEWLQSGMIFFAADSARSAQRNINTITSVGMLGIVVLMLWVFRSFRALSASVLAIISGVVFAFAVSHLFWGSVHILTLLFGASLIGVAVDYSLHLYYFRFVVPIADNRRDGHFYSALLLSLLTSIVGYGALAMSGLETLQQVALFSIAGLIYACLWVLFSEYWATRKLRIKDTVLQQLTNALVSLLRPVARVRYLAAASAGLWLVVTLMGARFIFDDSPKAFITQNPDLLNNERRLAEWLGEYEPATFVLLHGESDAELFGKIHQFTAAAQSKPAIFRGAKKELLGIHTLLPSPDEQRRNQTLSGALYDSQPLVEALTRTYGILDPAQMAQLQTQYQQRSDEVLSPEHFLEQLPDYPRLWLEQSHEGDGKRIVTALLIPKNADLHELKTLVENLPGVEWVSLVEDTQNGLRHLRITAVYYLGFALLLICGIFIWRYGARRGLILSLFPVAVVGLICATYLIAQVPVTLFHVMAAFLVVGLGVDYLVFVAEMMEEEESSLHFANALVLSAVTSGLSFGLLSLSIMPAVSAFGTTAMLGILGNLLGAFLLMSMWTSAKEK